MTTKQKSTEMTDDDAFAWAVRTTVALADDHGFRWKVSPGGSFRPRLEEEQVRKVLPSEEQYDKYKQIVGREVALALEAAATGAPPHLLLRRVVPEPSEEDVAVFMKRTALVAEQLLNRELKERVQLRRTCKGKVLDNLRWHISLKKHDLGEGALEDIPYATVQLGLSETSEDHRTALLQMFGFESPERVTFDCHADDVSELIADLEVLRDNLKQLTVARRKDEDGQRP